MTFPCPAVRPPIVVVSAPAPIQIPRPIVSAIELACRIGADVVSADDVVGSGAGNADPEVGVAGDHVAIQRRRSSDDVAGPLPDIDTLALAATADTVCRQTEIIADDGIVIRSGNVNRIVGKPSNHKTANRRTATPSIQTKSIYNGSATIQDDQRTAYKVRFGRCIDGDLIRDALQHGSKINRMNSGSADV